MKLISTNRHNLPRVGRTGFSLVELLIATLIMGILLGIAIPTYLTSQNSTKQQACQTNMSAIFQAEESYRAKSSTRTYSTNLSDLTGSMASLPQCPCGTSDYTITVTGAGSTLALQISCPNPGGHLTGKTMVTTDGQTFSFQ